MDKQQFLEKAFDYVHNAKVSIIPVGADKRPMVEWKEFQTRYATDEEIAKWSEFPGVQLGIVTGKLSNLTVVDVEKGGDASFLPQSGTIIETGGGGAHFYFAYCEDMKNKARIRDLVDLRSEGGYVVAPRSVSNKGEYRLVQQGPLGEFPAEFFEEAKRPTRYGGDIFEAVPTTKSEIENYQGYGAGQRNDEITRYIGHVLSRIHPAKWDTEAWNIIVEANKKNVPPLSDHELTTSYNSIKNTEITNNPRRWSERNVAPTKNWDAQDELGDGRIMLMSEVAKLQHIEIDAYHPLGFPIFDTEIMGGAIPGDLISIAGMSGEGKTSFAMNLAKNFVQSGGAVLFFSYEMLVQFVWEKFKNMGMRDDEALYAPFKNITGNVEWIEKKIKEAKQSHDVKFVVIDHLGFLAPAMSGMSSRATENYSVYITSIMRELKTVAKNEEIIIILPVHMRKREAFFKKNTDLDINDIAHSAGVAQESDLVFLIQREKDTRVGAPDVYSGYSTISLAKNRRGSKNPKGFFTMINDQFVYDEMYGGIDSQGSAAGRGGRGYGDHIVNNPSIPKKDAEDSISKLLQTGMTKEDALREKVDRTAGLFDDPTNSSDEVSQNFN